ncbi:hypothetical protein [Blautia sp. HCP28S3_G10]|uniref:hypothetical protein n=1 Tax=Blautia sp. HCP28S3_G10 TaxID=3438908 RepID=UPI003F8B4393
MKQVQVLEATKAAPNSNGRRTAGIQIERIRVVLLGFIGESIANRTSINYWGRRSLFLLAYGLVICCFAAARDGLDKTIQNTINGSCAPGVFSLVSIPNLIGCIGATIIIISAVATPIAKSQHMRQIWFYVMSSGVMLKILVMEVARIIVRV